jgi:acyl-CoA synthetase (AMP-forming)/AMP-acid ligase II
LRRQISIQSAVAVVSREQTHKENGMIIQSPYPDPKIPDLSLPEFVLRGAEGHPSRDAIVDSAGGSRLSYAELADEVRRTGAGLVARGLAKGDVVAFCLPNLPEFVVGLYAILSVGGVVTTLNPACTDDEAAAQLTDSRACWLLTTSELAGRLSRTIAASAVREVFIVGEGDGGTPFTALSQGTIPSGHVSRALPDDAAVVLYSSGTTGLPKGVVLTHRNLVANLCSQCRPDPVTEDDVVLAALPMYHIAGMEIVTNHALASGATLVTMPRFDLETFLALIERHRVTRMVVAPPIVLALAKHPAVANYDLSSLRVITSGAAPLSGELARSCAQRLGCRVKQGYGMTETSAISFAPDDGPDRPESIGPPAPGVSCRIVDPVSGNDVPAGYTGELLARSAAVMRGYLGNDAATAATIDAGGWLHTGDIVRVDSDGWLYVLDRVKELIKYKGHQVAPAELEALLLTHPAVADAAVVPSPDDVAGEIPKAFVVLRDAVSDEALLAFVARRVAPYKKIRRLELTDAIPKSPSGKILRRVLVERERAGTGVALVGVH